MVSLLSKIFLIIRIAIIISGLIGNVISFLIFSRPVFKKNSISKYYRALAIFDCFTIYDLIVSIGLVFYDTFYVTYSDATCKLYFYFGMGFASIPGWILIAFSIDKVLSMKRIGTIILKKKSVQFGIVLSIVLINLLLYIGVPIYLELKQFNVFDMTFDVCDSSTLSFGGFISTLYLVEGSVLPFAIMLTTSIYSIKLIRDSAKNIERSSNGNVADRNSRDFKFAITSVVFNISFIVLKLPLTMVVFLANFIPGLLTAYDLLAVVATISFIHYSSGFFIHLASNSMFRRELMSFIKRTPINLGSITNNNAAFNQRSNVVSFMNKIEATN
jgi:hypothetical protein